MSGRRRLSEKDHEARRARDRERLKAAARELQTSEGFKRWIQVRRSNGLGRYSINNTMLIASQAWAKGIVPTYVCGYRRWAEFGYQVRRGEKAISILGPIRRWVTDEATGERAKRVVGFTGLPVFDVAQVEAGPEAVPLEPDPPKPIEGSSHEYLLEPLVAYAKSMGSQVSFEEIPGGADGWYRSSDHKIAVESRLLWPNRRVRTLLHELGHRLVAVERGIDEDLPAFSYAEEECVVECVGHIVASGLGLDTSSESMNYVASWGEDGRLAVVTSAASLIDRLARRIEDALALGAEQGSLTRAEPRLESDLCRRPDPPSQPCPGPAARR